MSIVTSSVPLQIVYLGFMMTDIWRFTYCCSRRVRSGKFKSVSVEESRTPEVDLAKKDHNLTFALTINGVSMVESGLHLQLKKVDLPDMEF